MTTNETSFFRDLHPFETLRTTIIPELLELRSSNAQLDIWCMACSSGQEPYSILFTIEEHFRQLSEWKIRVLSSDLSREMVERTRQGSYTQLEVNRGLPAPLLVKHFVRQGTHWQVKPEIRNMLDLREINLAKPWPQIPSMDIIFLRNVLIYFDVATRKDILRRVARVLRPDGYLFLGGAETVSGLDDQFERVTYGRTVCYRMRSGEPGRNGHAR
jgi:chemotaxis protein methyltransferase CheR